MKNSLNFKRTIVSIVYGIIVMIIPLSCDKGFEEMNKDPNKTNVLLPNYLFTRTQLTAIGLDYEGVGYRNANQVMSVGCSSMQIVSLLVEEVISIRK